MATLDPYSDGPFKIKREGQEIVVRQNRLSPTTIRVTWTLPNAVSCAMPAAYNGAIVTLDRTPTTLDKLPVDGNIYNADATADIGLHAGDKIGTALVVGTFYNDITTTSIDISDANVEEPFYVSVHAVDNTYRYHTDGVHSYSLPFGKKLDMATAAYQKVKLGSMGIEPDAMTRLDPTTTYTFKLRVDDIQPDLEVSFDGIDAPTYAQFVDEINKSLLEQQYDVVSEAIPYADTYYMNVPKRLLYKHNGTQYVQVAALQTATNDPSVPNVGTHWWNPTSEVLAQWDGAAWMVNEYNKLDRDPRNPFCNDYWYNGSSMYKWNGGAWISQVVYGQTLDPQLPPIMTCGMYWYHDGKVYNWDEATCKWVEVAFTATPPMPPVSGAIWYDASVPTVKVWDVIEAVWVAMPTFIGATDPSLASTAAQGVIWHDTTIDAYYKLDGTSWVKIVPILSSVKPQLMPDGSIWLNSRTGLFSKLSMGMWQQFSVITMSTPPNEIAIGSFWFEPTSLLLSQWDGVLWLPVAYTTTQIATTIGTVWYNPMTGQLSKWNGKSWQPIAPTATASLDEEGNLLLTSGTVGSTSSIFITSAGNLWNGIALTPLATLQHPMKGTDPVTNVPSYMQIGVGTDGSQDERRGLIETIKNLLGWPVIEVELTKAQMDVAIDLALEKLRSASSSAYKRGYFPLQLLPRVQKYKLTDATVGYNKIVDVFYIYRSQATFLGSAQGNNVYGQMAVQQLFNMGKFDLVSYHMVSSYIETMQQLFAAEPQFGWDENTRILHIMKDFTNMETVLVDAMLERTEQELITDRWTKNWIKKYAAAQCRYMLAEIRGKFSTLPGAGGAISLNSADLRSKADQEIQECMDEIDNYVVNNKTDFGLATDFVLG